MLKKGGMAKSWRNGRMCRGLVASHLTSIRVLCAELRLGQHAEGEHADQQPVGGEIQSAGRA